MLWDFRGQERRHFNRKLLRAEVRVSPATGSEEPLVKVS